MSTSIFFGIGGFVIGFIFAYILYVTLIKNKATKASSIELEPQVDTVTLVSEELTRICNELKNGNWLATCDHSRFDNTNASIAHAINELLALPLGLIDAVPTPIVVLSKDARITYINRAGRDQGFDSSVYGMTPYQLEQNDDMRKIENLVKEVALSGTVKTAQVILTAPNGDELIEEYIFGPLKDTSGHILGALWANFDVSATVAKTRKISAYQANEAADMAQKLREGLAIGRLAFNFAPEPHDTDTADAANAYRTIGDTLQDAVGSIQTYMQEITQVLSAVAGGDLTKSISREFLGDFAPIKDSVNAIVMRLNETVEDISHVADGVSGGSEQLANASIGLADGTNRQMAAVQEMGAGIEVIDTQAKDNATNAQKAADLAITSKTNAETGNAQMQNLLSAMERISQSSSEISKVINTIESIAFQTNLLALNAAVEAARAGELGRGFSVVAEEVRSLASRSAEAAKETTALIEESINNVKAGTQAASDTASSLDKIVQNVTDVSAIINEISSSSDRQTEAVGGIHSDLEQITSAAQSSAATSEETAASAEELDSQVTVLKEKLAFFNTDVSMMATRKVWDVTTADKMGQATTALKNAPGKHLTFNAGEAIITEGERADTMYFVLEGSVKVVKSHNTLNARELATLRTGDLFGEMALFLNEPRTASVIANSSVKVVEIHRDTVTDFIEKSSEVAYVLVETLCARLKNLLANSNTY